MFFEKYKVKYDQFYPFRILLTQSLVNFTKSLFFCQVLLTRKQRRELGEGEKRQAERALGTNDQAHFAGVRRKLSGHQAPPRVRQEKLGGDRLRGASRHAPPQEGAAGEKETDPGSGRDQQVEGESVEGAGGEENDAGGKMRGKEATEQAFSAGEKFSV